LGLARWQQIASVSLISSSNFSRRALVILLILIKQSAICKSCIIVIY